MNAFQEEIKQAVSEATAPLSAEIASLKKLIAESVEKDPLISLDDAAKKLGCHKATLRRKIKSGELECVRIGKKIFFNRSELFTKSTHN
ncbi:helix-turn-helix domain-containing protein [Thalassospira sp.]|uniref:helix-turn-helix domain-containing protein n=1 Tax=Thalassospira sp. TaxID=1912094 RepID=UPI001B0FF984|nr:helix-turn-helix domain-containing protein [Thalassospira sp.]MBO6808446.1 helix-turn-helix domain-containing protein [Thalassospira sp.]MBO6839856.1 helix-turn-helix domain-containing protein [Thalassospira sp.]